MQYICIYLFILGVNKRLLLLNNLKFTESQTNSKTIELQEAIKKAIANEDYEKAAALKKELEASKNGTNPTSTTTTKTNTPTINKVENKIENKKNVLKDSAL